MPRFFSGNLGIAQSGATVLGITGWIAECRNDVIDTTSTSDGGYRSAIAGPRELRGEILLPFDAQQSPFGDPPQLVAGASIALKLHLESASGPAFDVPTALIEGVQVRSRVGDVVNVAVRFRSVGIFTLPTSSF